MAQLIDKAALVAEIGRRIKEYQSTGDDYWFPVIENLKSILSFIDTLEVKEVDLEKEYNNYMEKYNGVWVDSDYIKFAKHFFELGMEVSNKAQEGE